MKKRDLKITYRKVGELIPYARNARTHSQEQIQRIAASIKEFGFTNPILVDGENGIIAGHGRLAAAQLLGLESVPTIELSGMTETQKRAYILADNKLALDAGWDDDLLKVEIEDLKSVGFDLNLTGFFEDEVESILNGWTSDFSPPSEDYSHDDQKKIVIRVASDDYDHAVEVLTNALDSSGIGYEF